MNLLITVMNYLSVSMNRHQLRNTALSIGLIATPAIALTLMRPILSETDSYIYMNWNLFLGILPLIFAAFHYKKVGGKMFSVLWFILWIGFLPNAPYMITDFIHIADVGPKSILWMDSIMLFGFAWVGMICWLQSVSLIYETVRAKSFIPIISLLTAIGLYLGRYIRFNTWDALTQPLEIVKTVLDVFLNPLNHEPFLLFIAVFWIFLMVSYVGYSNLHHLVSSPKNQS